MVPPFIINAMKSDNVNKINYVNNIMSIINELSTDIYEAMMDGEDSNVKAYAERMIELMKQIKSQHTDEFLL
jgi:hypothetical protein